MVIENVKMKKARADLRRAGLPGVAGISAAAA
jgi:hypothetical protein